jgi:hypothetical protein
MTQRSLTVIGPVPWRCARFAFSAFWSGLPFRSMRGGEPAKAELAKDASFTTNDLRIATIPVSEPAVLTVLAAGGVIFRHRKV